MAKKKEVSEPLSYKGLIIAHCKSCGGYTVFYSNDETNLFKCHSCGEVVSLNTPAIPLISKCECGNRIRAVTNSDEDCFQFNCKCGYPNSVAYSYRKDKYFGML